VETWKEKNLRLGA